MATPISAFFSSGASFTPSPVTATISPISCRAVDHAELLLGCHAGKDHLAGELALEFLIAHLRKLEARDDGQVVALDDADAAGDARVAVRP